MAGIPTIDVANLGFWATCLASLKAFFGWIGTAWSWLGTHVFAFVLSNKIAVSITFGAFVVGLITSAATALSYCIGFIIDSFTDHVSLTGEIWGNASKIIGTFIDFDSVESIITFGISSFGTYLLIVKTGFAFRMCVKIFDKIAQAYKL